LPPRDSTHDLADSIHDLPDSMCNSAECSSSRQDLSDPGSDPRGQDIL